MFRRPLPRVLLGVLLVAVLTGLGLLLWPRPASTTRLFTGSSAGHTVSLRFDQLDTGPDTVDVTLNPATDVDGVTLEAVMPNMGHGLSPMTATRISAGQFQAHGRLFVMGGGWEVWVIMRTKSGTETASVVVDVP